MPVSESAADHVLNKAGALVAVALVSATALLLGSSLAALFGLR